MLGAAAAAAAAAEAAAAALFASFAAAAAQPSTDASDDDDDDEPPLPPLALPLPRCDSLGNAKVGGRGSGGRRDEREAVAVAGPPPRGVTTTFSADDAFSSSVVAAAAFAEGTKSDLLPFLSSHRTSAAEGAGRPRFPGDEGGVTATAHGSSGAQAAGPPFVGVFGAEGKFFSLQIFSRAKEK